MDEDPIRLRLTAETCRRLVGALNDAETVARLTTLAEECERKLSRKQELDVELEADPFRVAKRKCADCGADIPNWRNGRRVSAATRFCSDRCRKSAARMVDGPDPVLSAETAKKCPKNKGFLGVKSRPTKVETRPTALVPSRWEPAPDIDPVGVPDLPDFLRRG